MTHVDIEPYRVVEAVRCDDVSSLTAIIYSMCERDPRGEEVGQATAVAIDNKYVHVELREYEDGTRTFVLSGV